MDIREAIEAGDVSGLAKLISEGTTVESDVLIEATMGRGGSRLPIVRSLLEGGADPNYSNGCTTALEVACSSSTPDVVQLLLEAGADPEVGSPAHAAVEGGNVDALAYLAGAGVPMDEPLDGDPDELGDICGLTPLQYAQFLGRTRCMAMLQRIASGADDPAPNDDSIATALTRIRAVAEQALDASSPGDGASPTEISQIESDLALRLPADLQELLQTVNGYKGVIPFDAYNATLGSLDEDEERYDFLSLDEIKQASDEWKKLVASGEFAYKPSDPQLGIEGVWWHSGWIPFASNGGGDYLCVDIAPTTDGAVGQVITTSHESKDRVLLAGSLAAWLSHLALHLETLANLKSS